MSFSKLSPEAQLAKRWGRARGFSNLGGAIRSKGGALVCRGWSEFARRYRNAIVADGRPSRGRALKAGWDELVRQQAQQRTLSLDLERRIRAGGL